MRIRIALVVCAILGATGCGSTPKPPPEPNMKHLVPVNKTVPSELEGQVVLPVNTPIQKAEDARE